MIDREGVVRDIRLCICPDKGMLTADADCPYHEGIPIGPIQWPSAHRLQILGSPLGGPQR